MTTRQLGRSGLAVSRLGLGLAAVGRPGYINLGRAHDLPAERTPAALYARAAELLDAARAAGIRYLDVARSYGRAEEFLARWLGEGGQRARRLGVEGERQRAQVRGELRGGRGAREHDVDEGPGQHEGERELVDAAAQPAGRRAERTHQARVLGAGVGRR